MTKSIAIEREDIIAAIKELHLENQQLRNRLENIVAIVRDMQSEHIALAKRVKLLYDDDFRD